MHCYPLGSEPRGTQISPIGAIPKKNQPGKWACLGQQGISHNTIRAYLSGIRQIQIAHRFKDPHTEHMPRLRQVLKGVKVEAGKAGKPAHSHLPITPSILRKIKRVWMDRTTESFDNIMLWAAPLTTFFSFCRAGETTVPSEDSYNPDAYLSYSDIAVNDAKTPSIVSLRTKQSKTDQESWYEGGHW